jgi:ribosomal protein S27AE
MFEYTRFQYCPRCAAPALTPHEGKALLCQACGFTYYHGTAAAVVGIIVQDGKVLLSRRGCDPQKGWLGAGRFRGLLRDARRRLRRGAGVNLEMTRRLFLLAVGQYP